MKIWAHRGCSQSYPENTMVSFAKAAELEKLIGIELDIQMTKDGEIVVIHDERVDRTTGGIGYVKDYTYSEIRTLLIETGDVRKEKIPSIHEVLDLLQDKMKEGLLLNIELKNSEIIYAGMEEKIMELVAQRNLQNQVVYSSFYTMSLHKVRQIDADASIGILDTKISDCIYKKNGCFEKDDRRIALHPFWKGIDFSKEQLHGQTVRSWMAGHLYPQKPTGRKLDFEHLEAMGITDVFLNEPEVYLE